MIAVGLSLVSVTLWLAIWVVVTRPRSLQPLFGLSRPRWFAFYWLCELQTATVSLQDRVLGRPR